MPGNNHSRGARLGRNSFPNMSSRIGLQKSASKRQIADMMVNTYFISMDEKYAPSSLSMPMTMGMNGSAMELGNVSSSSEMDTAAA